MEQSLGPASCPGDLAIPPDVELSDGLTEDEAVVLALWNQAAYQELLAELGISHARLFDAGLLPDPEFVILFPLGPKQLEYTFYQSIDALWLQPVRRKAAALDVNRVAQDMVQNGLNVIRDARTAHADLLFSQQRADLAREAVRIRTQIADLAEKRLQAGDISELEAIDSQSQAVAASADVIRFQQDVALAQNRLRELTGLTLMDADFVAVESPLPQRPDSDDVALLEEGLAMRPDLRAAEIAIATAAQQTRLARYQFMRLDGMYDANGQGIDGFESGPGFRLTIPILNRNRGAIAIAEAQLDQSQRRYVTVRDRVATEIRNAHVQVGQAADSLEIVQRELLPRLDSAVGYAEKSYQDGGADYFFVLQTTSQFLDARARELELSQALRRAIAELERSVGHRLAAPAAA